MRRVVIGSVALTGVVVLVLGLLYTFQRKLVYFPDAKPVPPAEVVVPGAEDVTLRTADGLELGAWWLPPTGRDRELAVLVAPGNGGNREGRADLGMLLAAEGFGVLLLDYRGYGGNPGTPSEEGLARDADAAVTALTDRGFPPERTIYLGESLGTGVVAGLLARHPPAGVVLRSPFTELAAVGRHHYPWLPVGRLLRDRFPVSDHVADSTAPLVVVHGDRDSVVPSELSAQVAAAAPGLVEEVVLDADHNDAVMFGAPVVQAVVRVADAVDRG